MPAIPVSPLHPPGDSGGTLAPGAGIGGSEDTARGWLHSGAACLDLWVCLTEQECSQKVWDHPAGVSSLVGMCLATLRGSQLTLSPCGVTGARVPPWSPRVPPKGTAWVCDIVTCGPKHSGPGSAHLPVTSSLAPPRQTPEPAPASAQRAELRRTGIWVPEGPVTGRSHAQVRPHSRVVPSRLWVESSHGQCARVR